MPWLKPAIRLFLPEEFEGAGVGRCGEGKEGEVGLPTPLPDLLQDDFLDLLFVRRSTRFLGRGLIQSLRRQYRLQALGILALLRRMGLVDNHREPLTRKLGYLSGDDRKLLERGDDDPPSSLERGEEVLRGLVDVLDHTDDSLGLPDRTLEPPIEHSPVADHHDRIEDHVVVRVM